MFLFENYALSLPADERYATDAAGLIGEGTHQRAVITVDRFMDKCQAKLG